MPYTNKQMMDHRRNT